jgi:hypothetical protein
VTRQAEQHHQWYEAYSLTVFETDAKKMPQRIAAARSAIHRTLQELTLHGGAGSEELETALDRLVILETETASWPKTEDA